MLRLRPYKSGDAEIINSWFQDEAESDYEHDN